MRTKVTEQDLLVPKQLLGGVDEVEIRREQDVILVVPVTPGDPIHELGKQPVVDDIDDASVNHDRFR